MHLDDIVHGGWLAGCIMGRAFGLVERTAAADVVRRMMMMTTTRMDGQQQPAEELPEELCGVVKCIQIQVPDGL